MVTAVQHFQQGQTSLQGRRSPTAQVISVAVGFSMAPHKRSSASSNSKFFIFQCIEASKRMHAQNRFYWCEHPEDLGRTKSGDTPASIWQFPAMRDLAELTSAACWALHQCKYGAPTSKPTRLMSNLPACQQFEQHWPTFDGDGFYAGPLGRCPHDFHAPLLGFNVQLQKWNTADSAAYPAAMCEAIALDVASALPLCMATQGAHASAASAVTTPPQGRRENTHSKLPQDLPPHWSPTGRINQIAWR